jgi:uncharacterized membrane protein YjjP (DUF1212 family)
MNYKVLGRLTRWVIWGLSAIIAGAIKPLFFPSGGWIYAIVAISAVIVCAIIGILLEKAISNFNRS